MDGGTLYQLRNLINRRNVVSDPSDDVNACEDFLELIVIAHILCAIMAVLGMETLDDNPSSVFFPEGEVREKTAVLQSAAKVVINDYTDFTYPARKQPTSPKDHILEYARGSHSGTLLPGLQGCYPRGGWNQGTEVLEVPTIVLSCYRTQKLYN